MSRVFISNPHGTHILFAISIHMRFKILSTGLHSIYTFTTTHYFFFAWWSANKIMLGYVPMLFFVPALSGKKVYGFDLRIHDPWFLGMQSWLCNILHGIHLSIPEICWKLFRLSTAIRTSSMILSVTLFSLGSVVSKFWRWLDCHILISTVIWS